MPQAAMPPEQAQAPQAAGGAMPPGTDNPLTQMIVQTDQSIDQIAQIISKASPEAGQALAQLAEQFRQIISSIMNQGQGQGGPQEASQMVSPETHGKPAQQSY